METAINARDIALAYVEALNREDRRMRMVPGRGCSVYTQRRTGGWSTRIQHLQTLEKRT